MAAGIPCATGRAPPARSWSALNGPRNPLKSRGLVRSIALPFLLSSAGCDMISDLSPTNVLAIEVTGDAYNWYFRYPGRDGALGTDDDQHSVQDLYLPENADIVLKLTSNDYLYSFALPDLDLREVAVPGLSFELQFHTKGHQTLQILGDQFCGFAHETLIGKVHIGIEGDSHY